MGCSQYAEYEGCDDSGRDGGNKVVVEGFLFSHIVQKQMYSSCGSQCRCLPDLTHVCGWRTQLLYVLHGRALKAPIADSDTPYCPPSFIFLFEAVHEHAES